VTQASKSNESQDLSQLDDIRWMRAALEWSHRGRGWNSPRPSVGCVLVRDGAIIGAGHTQPGHGNPHAEVMALRVAASNDQKTQGATAYVTLEPCCHTATTPPCTDALIRAGIKRVVCGVIDPNPAVDGQGYEKLRAAGVEVVTGVLEKECIRAQDDFLKHIATHTPFVTLKCAVSLDGKIATPTGESQWITGQEARRRAHQLRHEHDSVLVGIETVLADDPQLNVRLEGRWSQPARVVVDSRGRLPLSARVLHNAGPATVYIGTTEAMSQERHDAFVASGAQVLQTPSQDGHVDLRVLRDLLYDHGIYSILIEGGAHIAGAALAAGIVDKIVFFIAPTIIGEGRDAVVGVQVDKLTEACRLLDVEVERVGDDVMVSGYTHPIVRRADADPPLKHRAEGLEAP